MNTDQLRLSQSGIARLLHLLPTLEEKTTPYDCEDETNPLHPHWSAELRDLHSALYASGLVRMYDWPEWQSEAEKFFRVPDRLADADIDTISKLLTLHVRQDRFVSGHLAAMCEHGHIQAILRRLLTLWDSGQLSFYTEPPPDTDRHGR